MLTLVMTKNILIHHWSIQGPFQIPIAHYESVPYFPSNVINLNWHYQFELWLFTTDSTLPLSTITFKYTFPRTIGHFPRPLAELPVGFRLRFRLLYSFHPSDLDLSPSAKFEGGFRQRSRLIYSSPPFDLDPDHSTMHIAFQPSLRVALGSAPASYVHLLLLT